MRALRGDVWAVWLYVWDVWLLYGTVWCMGCMGCMAVWPYQSVRQGVRDVWAEKAVSPVRDFAGARTRTGARFEE